MFSFRIDFLTAQNQIAFHINPRFHLGVIVRNSDLGGWGPEDRHGGFPFKHNHPFEMCISAESDHFKVAVNGQHLFDYNHRAPLDSIVRLAISGQIDCHGITYVGVSWNINLILNKIFLILLT